MLPRKIEEIVMPVVEKFVASQNGRYREHCSDGMLTALIIFHLGNPSRRYENKCLAEAFILGDRNAAYDAVCWLFEHVLEHKCRASGNGHHVAQAFSEAMMILENEDVDRSHEECADCALEHSDPPKCNGHVAGPVECGSFVSKG